MTDACILPIVAATGTARLRMVVGRIENPCSDKELRENVTAGPQHQGASDAGHERRRASHSGTTSNAPLWNGPRLQAAFVAQVLGQVLSPPSSNPQSALAAYQRNDVRVLQSRLLDSEV
jgi:hypothetical protein